MRAIIKNVYNNVIKCYNKSLPWRKLNSYNLEHLTGMPLGVPTLRRPVDFSRSGAW
jgi:hypothetical protein